jgi:hypothetical protein
MVCGVLFVNTESHGLHVLYVKGICEIYGGCTFIAHVAFGCRIHRASMQCFAVCLVLRVGLQLIALPVVLLPIPTSCDGTAGTLLWFSVGSLQDVAPAFPEVSAWHVMSWDGVAITPLPRRG